MKREKKWREKKENTQPGIRTIQKADSTHTHTAGLGRISAEGKPEQ